MFTFYARKTSANKKCKIWTNDNHPEEIFSQDFFYQKLQYINENPVRAGAFYSLFLRGNVGATGLDSLSFFVIESTLDYL